MESVVLTSKDTILQTEDNTSNIVSSEIGNVKVDATVTSYVTQTVTANVLVQSVSSEVILAGAIGPRGLNAEDIDVYSKRIDFVSDNELYKGEALAGSSETAAVWRIRKVLIEVDSDISEKWASGTTDFDKVWANRLALSYS